MILLIFSWFLWLSSAFSSGVNTRFLSSKISVMLVVSKVLRSLYWFDLCGGNKCVENFYMVSAKGSIGVNSLVEDFKVSFRGVISLDDCYDVLGYDLLSMDANLSVSYCLISVSFSLNAFNLDLIVVNLNLSRWFVERNPLVLYIMLPRGVINLLRSILGERSSSVGDEKVLIKSPEVVATSVGI